MADAATLSTRNTRSDEADGKHGRVRRKRDRGQALGGSPMAQLTARGSEENAWRPRSGHLSALSTFPEQVAGAVRGILEAVFGLDMGRIGPWAK
jgi:hypothetical protein